MSNHSPISRWDVELEAEGPVREVWLLEAEGDLTKVSVEMWDVAPDSKTYADFTGGFPLIVSGMRTPLQTGTPLT